MLNAFRQQLKQLSLESRDPYTSIVRRLVGPRAAVEYEKPLRQMILALPDMAHQVHQWTDAPALPAPLRPLNTFVLRYLFHPDDFLSEKNLGLFGYLDDAYIVASVYERILSQSRANGGRLTVGDPALAKNIPQWTALVRALLPNETKKMDQLLDEVKYHKENGYSAVIHRVAKSSVMARKLEKEVGRGR